MNKAGLLGLYRQSRATQHITTHGTLLAVQRRLAGTNTTTTQTLTCIPMTDDKAQEALAAEGDVNSASAIPMEIIFAGTADVRENVDRVVYHGWYYRLTTVYPTAEQNGVVISYTARAIRDGKVVA